MRGRAALEAEWTGLADPARNSAAFLERLESALDSGKSARSEGDVASAMSVAATHLDATYHAPFQAHAAMEPLSCVADVRADRCEVWIGTQRPNGVKTLASRLLGVPEDRVTVHVMLIGGAFGRRIAIDHAQEAIELSRAIRAPVQVVWTREDDFAHDMYQAAQVNRLTAALDASGNIIGWRHHVADYHLSMFGQFNPDFDPAKDGDPWGGYDTPYAFPALDVRLSVLEAPVPTGAWRSVTYPAAVFARECFLDEVAHATRRDPLELRLSLIPSPGIQGTGNRARPNGDRLRNVLQLAAHRAEWGKPFPTTNDARRWGRGIACNPYDRGAMVAQVADVSVGADNDIRVHRVVTAIDVGRVIDRSGLEAQVEGGVAWALSAALKTEITFANGQAQQTNFNDFPVLRMREMPAQDIIVVESRLGPFGAGEPPVPAVYAAVGNAVFAATGQRLRRTPLRLS
jgi:isoquinoline 1-oxidoreductase beta subunit